MSELDKLFNAALKKPTASAVTEEGDVVNIEAPHEVTQVTTPTQPEAAHEPAGLPWDEANPRVISFFQIRMPEPLKMKIEWLELQHRMKGERSGSRGLQHQIALTALEREIDRLVAKELKAK